VNPGKPAAAIAALEIFFDDFPHDGPEISVLLLEPTLIFRHKPLEVMEETR
jgi:hypothetical protein